MSAPPAGLGQGQIKYLRGLAREHHERGAGLRETLEVAWADTNGHSDAAAQVVIEEWNRLARDAQDEAEEGRRSSIQPIPDYPQDALPPVIQELIDSAPLPVPYTAGAALAAAAIALGGDATIRADEGWTQRAILWVPLVGDVGSGKSPALERAFAPLRAHDQQQHAEYADKHSEWLTEPKNTRGPKPRPHMLLIGEATTEAIARELAHVRGGAGVAVDELAGFLENLGAYKRGGGDAAKLLELWTGAPWRNTRVGQGGNDNEVQQYIHAPTLSIVGTIQPARMGLLGASDDGRRARWLLHEAPPTTLDLDQASRAVPTAWHSTTQRLLDRRDVAREWNLSTTAQQQFKQHRKRWQTEAAQAMTTAEVEALAKADTQTLRVALVLAELEEADGDSLTPRDVGPDLIDRAAAIVDYCVGCWRSQYEPDVVAANYSDRAAQDNVGKFIRWLDSRRNGQATKREAQRSKVGFRTAKEFHELLGRLEAQHPGTVTDTHVMSPRYVGRTKVA